MSIWLTFDVGLMYLIVPFCSKVPFDLRNPETLH